MPLTNHRLYEIVNGWVRFRFTHEGERITFHPHIRESDTTIASAIEQIIRNDISSGQFDTSLIRYRVGDNRDDSPTLWETWRTWREDFDTATTNATLKKRRITEEWLQKFQNDNRPVGQAFDSFSRLLCSQLSASYAEQILKQVRRAVSEVDGIELDLPSFKKKKSGLIDVFSKQELKGLLDFVSKHESLTQDDVRFIYTLAYTGMRPSEAVGLECKHWDSETSQIRIIQAYDGKDIKNTKNLKHRTIKVSPVLAGILNNQTQNKHKNTPIFQGIRSFRYPYDNFIKSVWKHLMYETVELGIVHHYRNPYQLRHTFASIALARGESIEQLGAHLGNSPSTCRKHYAGYQPSSVILDF